MTKIIIPFNAWNRDKLRKRIKTCTSRTKQYGNVGDTFRVGLQNYILANVERLPLETVARDFWLDEGAESEADFIKQWVWIHPINKWKPEQMVWMHFFIEYP